MIVRKTNEMLIAKNENPKQQKPRDLLVSTLMKLHMEEYVHG